MHFPNKKTIELSFIEMGLFTNTLHLGDQKHTQKILRKCIPHQDDMFPQSSCSLNLAFLILIILLFLNFKDGDISKIPLLSFLHCRQPNSLLK